MSWIMPSLGYFAPISPERLTEGRTERNRTNSVNPCMVSRTVVYNAFGCRIVADIQMKLAK